MDAWCRYHDEPIVRPARRRLTPSAEAVSLAGVEAATAESAEIAARLRGSSLFSGLAPAVLEVVAAQVGLARVPARFRRLEPFGTGR